MDCQNAIPLRIGAWCVNPAAGNISREGEIVRVEARTMRLLLCLAECPGQVVSIDDLLSRVWAGVIVTPDSVYQAIAALRRLLGDDAKQPAYIATVPRLGYRMVATVSSSTDRPDQPEPPVAPSGQPVAPLSPPPVLADTPPAVATSAAPTRGPRRRGGVLLAAGAALSLALVAAFLIHSKVVNNQHTVAIVAPQKFGTRRKSVAVLPFLDLTSQGMDEEYFADGMTEELIDKLSKIPDLRVPAPTSSFYFKGKQLTVPKIAKSLGVAYVLDGSVRRSDAMLRIAVRLVRADDGYVVWSETYDRPSGDKLMVQDDIAGEVAKALRASIN